MRADAEPYLPGRPRKTRIRLAGEKLRMAFLLLKKTWGSNTDVQNHVFNMKRWDECGLPKSIKTVKEDIRSGISMDRVFSYASLLNVPPACLTDDGVKHADPAFIAAVMSGKADVTPPSITMQHVFGTAVVEKFFDYNRPEYLGELFGMLKGFYVVYLTKVPFDVGINKMVMAIHDVDDYCLRVDAKFYLETELNGMSGEIHRWGAFLIANYYLSNMQSFGFAMMPEPMRSPVISGRKPFYMSGKYLFGAEAFGREPLFALFHMEKRQELPENGWTEAFEAFAMEHISYQFIFSGDPEYDYAMLRLRSAGEGSWPETGLAQP